MKHLVDQIVRDALQPQAIPAVRISIPRDHPKADKLLKLAEALSVYTQLPSGIVVERPVVREDAAEVFLDALGEVIGPQVFHNLVAALDAKVKQCASLGFRSAKDALLKHPALLHSVFNTLGSSGLLAGMPSGEMAKFDNMASEGRA